MRITSLRSTSLALLLTFGASLSALATPPERTLSVDAVELVGGRETPGKADLVVMHEGFEYRFATPENKAAFLKGSGEAGSALFGKYWDAADERGRADAKQRNHVIETIAPAELDKWRPLLQATTDEWLKKANAKGVDGQKLLDDLKQMIKAASN